MHHLSQSKTKKAYSLLELIVSLAIIAISTVIMINFLVLSLQISLTSLGRSFVREEISNAFLAISRDIRNSDKINVINCYNGPVSYCDIEFSKTGGKYRWTLCQDETSYRMCREKWDNVAGNYIPEYQSSNSVNIGYFNIDYGYADSSVQDRINIIITVTAGHERTSTGVNDVVRQISISTRNYQI